MRDDVDAPGSLLGDGGCGLAWVDVHVEVEDAFGHVQLRVVGDGRAVEPEHHEPVEPSYGGQVANVCKTIEVEGLDVREVFESRKAGHVLQCDATVGMLGIGKSGIVRDAEAADAGHSFGCLAGELVVDVLAHDLCHALG